MNRSFIRHHHRPDGGFTVVEMLVAMAVVALALGLFVPTYLAIFNSSTVVDATTATGTEIQPVLAQLEREVGSAGLLVSPCSSISTTPGLLPSCNTNGAGQRGFALLMYIPATSTTGTCSQWAVYQGQLQHRTWSTTLSGSTAVDFVDAMPGITITNTATGSGPLQYPFTIGGSDNQLLTIHLWEQQSANAGPVEIRTALAAPGGQGPSSATGTCTPPPSND